MIKYVLAQQESADAEGRGIALSGVANGVTIGRHPTAHVVLDSCGGCWPSIKCSSQSAIFVAKLPVETL
jgi:hypothetical protein